VAVKRPDGALHKILLEMVRRNVYCAVQQIRRITMADNNTTTEAKAASEAPAKVAQTVADTVETVTKASATTAKRERAKTARRSARPAAAKKTATRSAPKSRTAAAKTRAATRKTATAANQRIENVNNNHFFSAFQAAPAFAPFQSLFADANDRSQDLVKRGQRVAEEITDIARANVEAIVEAGRVAAEGARSLSQDVLAKGRDSVEQTADAIRTFSEAKSPTEYLQLQSDFARSSFDRVVAETSKLTESWVKLAGEAIQPLSNRATANAERLNSLVA
jgi:phasin family protein